MRFYDKGTNMHRLWDSDMIERAGDDEDFWLADLAPLDTPENREAAMKGSVEGLGDREPAGRERSVPGARNRDADQARSEAG